MIKRVQIIKVGILLVVSIFLLLTIAFNSPDEKERSPWSIVLPEAPFGGRSAMSTTVFKDSLWVIGGWDGDHVYNDIWVSHDGVHWRKRLSHAPFRKRAVHAAVVFKKKLWIIGGLYLDKLHNIRDLNDIWYTSNGSDWTKVETHGPFSPRGGHSLTVHHGKLWLIGGIAGTKDIWSSTDGIKWKRELADSPFGARGVHSTVSFKGYLWVVGGIFVDQDNRYHGLNDIWRSKDGKTWEQVGEEFEFFAGGSSLVTFNNRIFTVGGLQLNGTVLHSTDGANWYIMDASSSFGERVAHNAVVFKKRLWVIGGFDGVDNRNDIWQSLPIDGLTDYINDSPQVSDN
jgi:hypothetical protein